MRFCNLTHMQSVKTQSCHEPLSHTVDKQMRVLPLISKTRTLAPLDNCTFTFGLKCDFTHICLIPKSLEFGTYHICVKQIFSPLPQRDAF